MNRQEVVGDVAYILWEAKPWLLLATDHCGPERKDSVSDICGMQRRNDRGIVSGADRQDVGLDELVPIAALWQSLLYL
jgi:hypothetical protein